MGATISDAEVFGYGSGGSTISDDDVFGRKKPAPIGKDSFAGFLKDELANADWGTRNIAGFGTALSNAWEGLKQKVGAGDEQAIEANRIIADAAPVGSIVGEGALLAGPFGLAKNGIKAAAAVGAGAGFFKPVEGEQTFENIATGTAKNTALSAALAAGGQAVANKVGGMVSNKLDDLAIKRAQAAPRTQVLDDALDAGLVVPPSSVKPTAWTTLKESLAGKTATAQVASNRNAAKFQDMARRELGLADDMAITPEVLQARRNLAYEVGYKPITEIQAVSPDTKFLMDAKNLSPASAGGAIKNPAQSKIDDIIESLTKRDGWTGEQIVADIRELRDQSTANFKSAGMPGGDSSARALARAQSQAAKSLEGLIERTKGVPSGAVQFMRDARKYIAKTHTVEDAMLPGSGVFDPRKVSNRAAGKLTGELKTAVDFAKNYPKAAQSEAQIAGPAVNNLGTLMKSALSGGAAVGGTALGGPVLGAAAASLPFIVPPAMRSRLLSRGAQNSLRDLYRLGLAPRMAGRVAQNAPIGLTVFGLDSFGQ